MRCVCGCRIIEILAGSLDAGIAVDEPDEVDELQPKIPNFFVSSTLLDRIGGAFDKDQPIPKNSGKRTTRHPTPPLRIRSAIVSASERLAPVNLEDGRSSSD
jgi:hypothetical protein